MNSINKFKNKKKDTLIFLQNAKRHFVTITRHRHQVLKNCVRSGIILQGFLHDLSKYSPTEFIVGALHYQGTRSPNEGEREDYGYSKAWMHHKGRNKHHYEYWTDYNPKTRMMSPVKMPQKYVIEMFCDRVAASKIYKGADYNDRSPLEYYNNGKAKFHMHEETARQLEVLLNMLADKGEKSTFSYIRRINLLGKKL